jgi:nucleoside-diphosphate-sugar epimerase/predicted dehydrogenase
MATSADECDALISAARAGSAALAVNHNYIHHPAHRALKKVLSAGEIGQPRHVTIRFSMPLHQLATRQFGHWMFDEPGNLLLEQAVHPLSQIEDLLGPTVDMSALASPPLRVGLGLDLQLTWLVSLTCTSGTAQLLFSLGETYPSWGVTVLGRDGAIHADYVANRVWREEARKWLEPLSLYRTGIVSATEIKRQSQRNLASYAASTLKLRPRSDGFFVSMRSSITAFHRALDEQKDALDGTDGRRIVLLCERIAGSALARRARTTSKMPVTAEAATPTRCPLVLTGSGPSHGLNDPDATSILLDPEIRREPAKGGSDGKTNRNAPRADVLVVGGTGFIGTPLVSALVGKGLHVAVLSRHPKNLPEVFWNENVAIHRGNITRREDLARALSGATAAVNLAHAGGATTWPDIKRALVGGALTLAELCLDEKIRRLVHVSSIAALYLGNRRSIVTSDTPTDPRPEQREPYSRAKAIVEADLLRLHRERGLPVCILRPGLVVGEGGPPFHSGIGFYNTERHCLGWNRGDNPLPFVLVDDVINAIIQALETPAAIGRCYNLVGGVRLTAREYTAELARALERPLYYHPQSLAKLYAIELCKWMVKRTIGRSDPWPSYRDLRSRGLTACFDCSDAGRDLGWRPVSNRAAFIRHGIDIHDRR